MAFSEGQLVREKSRREVFVIWGRARLQVSEPEFTAMGYKPAAVMVVADGSLAAVPRVPVAGTLLRERSRPEVYVMRGGRRLHIPSEYTLLALGHQWSQVRVVPNGCLAHIATETWPTLSGTPGSVVCLPYGSVWFPLRIGGTKQHRAWGTEVRTIELRGWLTEVGEDCNPVDPDWGYNLLLDAGWALRARLDLSSIVKLGNILQLGVKQPGATERAWISEPQIHLEVSGWPPKGQKERRRPQDWVAHHTENCPGALWPFDCRNPRRGDPLLRVGQYVRVVGSLISDKPHPNPTDEHLWLQKVWFANSNFESELTRWTEIHPPDTIEVLAVDRLRTETLRGVAVAAPGALTGWPVGETVLDVDIPAPPRPPGQVTLRVEEFVGASETDTTSIVAGNPTRTGARLTVRDDRVNVYIRIAGKKNIVGGSFGKFRALYRVFWERSTVPFGYLDDATQAPGGIRVHGWAIDPDAIAPIDVHVYVDGAFAGAATANLPRPDVAAAHPGFGQDHGFDFRVSALPGRHRVCVYAINILAGDRNPELGCRDVMVGTPAACQPLEDAIRRTQAAIARLQAELKTAPPGEKPALLEAIHEAQTELAARRAELAECVRQHSTA